jgi:hypothetical protein
MDRAYRLRGRHIGSLPRAEIDETNPLVRWVKLLVDCRTRGLDSKGVIETSDPAATIPLKHPDREGEWQRDVAICGGSDS